MRMRSRSEAAVISREPSLPSATTATRPPLNAAVLGGEGLDDALEQRCDQPLRERAIGAARPVRVEAPRQQIEADVKHLLGGEVARPVQRILEALRLRHERLDPRAHRLFVETGVEVDGARRIDRGVEHMRPRCDHLAPAAGRCRARRRTIRAKTRSSAGSTAARRSPACAPALRRRRRARRRRRPIRRRPRAAPASAPSAPRARAGCGPRRAGRSASRERSPPRLPGAESRARAAWPTSRDRRRRR